MENIKNKTPQAYDMINACFGGLFLMTKNSGTRPTHARNERLNEEKLRDKSTLEKSINIIDFVWTLDWPLTELAALPRTFRPRSLRKIRNGIYIICRSIF